MRTIKFRAKSIEWHNIGEWVFGDLHIRSAFSHIHTDLGTRCNIDPDTIGQFTGLLDKNGKEIYEGDIIRVNPVDSGIRYVKWDDRHAQFVSQMLHNEQCYLISYNDSQVIGNIYDNIDKGSEE